MAGRGFTLLTKKATHTKGRQIDHVYIKNAEATLNRYTPYYSDHDALCVAVEKVIYSLKFIIYRCGYLMSGRCQRSEIC